MQWITSETGAAIRTGVVGLITTAGFGCSLAASTYSTRGRAIGTKGGSGSQEVSRGFGANPIEFLATEIGYNATGQAFRLRPDGKAGVERGGQAHGRGQERGGGGGTFCCTASCTAAASGGSLMTSSAISYIRDFKLLP